MLFLKKFLFKVVPPLVLSVCLLSGVGAKTADAAAPPNSVELNTYGSLPVIVLNLTQSAVDLTLSTNSSFYTTGKMPFPLVVGLPGIYYTGGGGTISSPGTFFTGSGGATSTLANIANSNALSQSNASLNPLGSLQKNNFTFSNNYDWMSLFTVFPSWTTPGSYTNMQYVALSNLNNVGAAANSYNVVSGYPTGNGKNATVKGDFTSGSVLNAGNAAVTSINLNLRNVPAPGSEAITYGATYTVAINSKGAGTPGNPPSGLTAASILGALHTALDIISDAAVLASGDPLGIIDYIAGVPATIEGMVDNANANAYTTTDASYKAASAGIYVTAAATFNQAFPQTFIPYTGTSTSPYQGDSQSQIFEVSTTSSSLPLALQNYIAFTTWRQMPSNTGSTERTSADTLIVTILNNGVYASNQIQQYLNGTSSAIGSTRYSPTKEQAQDTLNLLTILTALSKNHPQDANTILGMFGMRGKYPGIKHDQGALHNMNNELKAIFEKHKSELPAIVPYLTKLERK